MFCSVEAYKTSTGSLSEVSLLKHSIYNEGVELYVRARESNAATGSIRRQPPPLLTMNDGRKCSWFMEERRAEILDILKNIYGYTPKALKSCRGNY